MNEQAKSRSPVGRTLGIDLGTKRIGVAVCDARGTLASPLVVVQRSGNIKADHRKLFALAQEEEVVRIVVGVPIDLSGKQGIAATKILDEIAAMVEATDLPVATFDERMSSASANRNLAAMGISEKKRREQIDKYAAAEILQGWLDSTNYESD